MAYLQTAGFPRLVSTISLDASRKRRAHPVKPRPSAAAIGCRAVTGTGQAGGHRHIGPWECESAHRTLGMRMPTTEPGDANASIGSWEYECVQIIMFMMPVLVV